MLPSSNDVNPYLEQEVLSASPVRLRWMLVRRAYELSLLAEQLWLQNKHEQAIQWTIRIREILNELLAGVQDATNPAGKAICDFYVFLSQYLTKLEASKELEQLKTFQELLSIECETWRQVSEQMAIAQADGNMLDPLSLSQSRVSQPAPHLPNRTPIAPPVNLSTGDDYLGGFSLEV